MLPLRKVTSSTNKMLPIRNVTSTTNKMLPIKMLPIQSYYTKMCFIYRVSQKSMICGAWWNIVPFLCNSPVRCFFNIFWKFIIYFLTSTGSTGSTAQKKSANLFFFQNQKFRKTKKLNKLFLSKSKILKRLNHRISENLQNCK